MLREHKLERPVEGQENATQIVWLEDGKYEVGERVQLLDSETPDLTWLISNAYGTMEEDAVPGDAKKCLAVAVVEPEETNA